MRMMSNLTAVSNFFIILIFHTINKTFVLLQETIQEGIFFSFWKIIIISTVVLKFLGWHPAGNSYVSRAAEPLFSLGFQWPRDGVSKIILVAVQPYNTLAYNEND